MTWIFAGNIKGADGTATIPDPLPVETRMDLGDDLRFVSIANGGRIEARSPNGVWHTQVEWQASNVSG